MTKILVLLVFLFSTLTGITYASPEIQINLPEYKLRLVDNGTVIKSYDIAVGDPAMQTPIGNYAVTEKEVNPTWYPTENQRLLGKKFTGPGPDNPLGVRWIQFNGVYGIHGTNEEDKIGSGYAFSAGCIHMRNADVTELYDQIEVGTPVTIVYQTILIAQKEDGLYVKALPDMYNQNTTTLENYKVALQNYINQYIAGLNFPDVTNQYVKVMNLKAKQKI